MIRVEHLSVRVGTFSLQDVSFEVPGGQYGILMGRTGSGKTTLLESLCGLKPLTAGRIVLCGTDVTRLRPAQRGIGFVPQDGALFPTMTVRRQIGFALSVRKWLRRDIDRRVIELSDLLGIRSLLHRDLTGLSGGERQRIALGRALAASPGVLCLDEPLSALDDATRQDMYTLLKSVQQKTGVTALHITHSRAEARILGDVVFSIEDGRVRRVPEPQLASQPVEAAGSNGDGAVESEGESTQTVIVGGQTRGEE